MKSLAYGCHFLETQSLIFEGFRTISHTTKVQLQIGLHHRRPGLVPGLLPELGSLGGGETTEDHELLGSRHGLHLEHGVEGPDVELDVVGDHEKVEGEEDDAGDEGHDAPRGEVVEMLGMDPSSDLLYVFSPDPSI